MMFLYIFIFIITLFFVFPLIRRAAFPPVLGYLITGIVIAPIFGHFFDLKPSADWIEYAAAPVVFWIGLITKPLAIQSHYQYFLKIYLPPLLVAGAIFTVLLSVFSTLSIASSLLLGYAFTLGSHALIVQTLALRTQTREKYDAYAHTVLLYHALIALILLAFLPLLKGSTDYSLQHGAAIFAALLMLGSGLLLFGRYLLQPAFNLLAKYKSTELFLSFAFSILIAVTYLTQMIGFHWLMGVFLSAVVLSEVQFRHELEKSLMPFKPICLGVFLLSLGLMIEGNYILDHALLLLCTTLGLMFIKFLSVLVMNHIKVKKYTLLENTQLSILLSHSGEFTLIIIGICLVQGILDQAMFSLAVMSISLSMILATLFGKALTSSNQPSEGSIKAQNNSAISDPNHQSTPPSSQAPIVILGFGRVGQVIARIAHLHHIPFIAIDNTFHQLEFLAPYGGRYIHANLTQTETLSSDIIASARSIILAIDDVEDALLITRYIRLHYPHIHLMIRTRDRHHSALSAELGINNLYRETFYASLELSKDLLIQLNINVEQHRLDQFKNYDEQLSQQQNRFGVTDLHNDSEHNEALDLQNLFENDQHVFHHQHQDKELSSRWSNLSQSQHHP